MKTIHKKRSSSGLYRRINRRGWWFVVPALALIALTCYYPMVQSFILSLYKGKGNTLTFAGLRNYQRFLQDKTFWAALKNTLFYLVIQVPVMLSLALILASILNNPKLKCKGIYRTLLFLPCATSLVCCSIVFKQLFATDGLINSLLMRWGAVSEPIGFLTNVTWARIVVVVMMLWRWTGQNMVFYLAGLQNIDSQVYEAARIDGASRAQQFSYITIPMMRPIILMTVILSTNGTMKMFDEVFCLTNGGPNDATITLSVYIYRLTFQNVPQFGYASAIAYVIFIIVAILAVLQMKVGEKNEG